MFFDLFVVVAGAFDVGRVSNTGCTNTGITDLNRESGILPPSSGRIPPSSGLYMLDCVGIIKKNRKGGEKIDIGNENGKQLENRMVKRHNT